MHKMRLGSTIIRKETITRLDKAATARKEQTTTTTRPKRPATQPPGTVITTVAYTTEAGA